MNAFQFLAAPVRRAATAGFFTIGLLAVCAAGATAAPPSSSQLSLSAGTRTVVYGQTVTLSGRLKGSDVAAKTIELRVNAFPFAGYVASTTTKTDVNGNFSFTVAPQVATRYQVAATDLAPVITSGEVTVQVSTKLSLKVSDATPKRGARVRFYGYAWPAHDGTVLYIQRRTSTGSFTNVAKTLLKDAGTARSAFSRSLRVRKSGVYIASIGATPENLAGTSPTKSVRVH